MSVRLVVRDGGCGEPWHHPPGPSPPRGGLPPTRLSDAPRHRCIIEPGNPTGGQPFCSNEKERRFDSALGASIQRDMENRRKRWRTSKGVAKVNGSKSWRIFQLSPRLFSRNSASRVARAIRREERRESRSRRGFFEKIRKRGKIEVDCWWKNVKRLSLKSLSREHRENRTTFNNRRNFLLHVAICNDAPLNYNFLPWNRMEESRYSY